MLDRLKTRLRGRPVDAERRFRRIHRKYSEFTMVPETSYVRNLELVARFSKVPGCVVECGVWRGGVSAGMAEVLGPDRPYFLFDSFAGLPPAQEIDGQAALAWQRDTTSSYYFDNCRAERAWAEKAMAMSGAPRVSLVEGWFERTIPPYQFPEPIAILRLDCDWYESTLLCLEKLYPLVSRGGLVVIDDYYVWDGCARALHTFLGRHQIADRIRPAYEAGCHLVKG